MPSIFRDHLLANRTAFITGGTSGIGLRIAQRFAEHGANVVIAGRSQARLDEALATIQPDGGSVDGDTLDVRDYAAVETALRETRERFGEIDIVVCAAAGN